MNTDKHRFFNKDIYPAIPVNFFSVSQRLYGSNLSQNNIAESFILHEFHAFRSDNFQKGNKR